MGLLYIVFTVFLSIGVMFLYLSGAVFCLVWPAGWLTNRSTVKYAQRPLALYWVSVWYTFMAGLVLYGASLLWFEYVLDFNSPSSFSPLLAMMIPLILLGVGLVGWGIKSYQWWKQRSLRETRKAEYKRRNLELPPVYKPPKPQIWMQDLFIAVLIYGTVLTIMLPKTDSWLVGPGVVAACVAYYFFCGIFGLWVFVDIFRRIELPVTPKSRALHLLPFFVVFLIVMPMGWVAWRVWQRALAHGNPEKYVWPPPVPPLPPPVASVPDPQPPLPQPPPAGAVS